MDINLFEKDVLFDFLRTIKRNTTRIVELFEESILERQKLNKLLSKLIKMLQEQ